jgi:hypothetical protein
MTDLVVPTVHLNGTSRKELQRQLRDAHEAIGTALDKLRMATPHGRDYYPQGDGAITLARRAHDARCAKLAEVQNELFAIWESIA